MAHHFMLLLVSTVLAVRYAILDMTSSMQKANLTAMFSYSGGGDGVACSGNGGTGRG